MSARPAAFLLASLLTLTPVLAATKPATAQVTTSEMLSDAGSSSFPPTYDPA